MYVCVHNRKIISVQMISNPLCDKNVFFFYSSGKSPIQSPMGRKKGAGVGARTAAHGTQSSKLYLAIVYLLRSSESSSFGLKIYVWRKRGCVLCSGDPTEMRETNENIHEVEKENNKTEVVRRR